MLMRAGEFIGDLADDQGGAVIVIVTLWMTLLIAMMSFVLDAGNWWVHKRHLQMQADAAALAAAGKVVVPCSDQPIVDEATKYSGSPGALFNAQIGGTPPERVHMLINSPTYYNQASPVDTTVDPNPPCTSKMIDVKLTETDLPWFFKALWVPHINAHARVAIRQVDRRSGALPVAVPEVNPTRAKAVFIDETNGGAVLGETPLVKEDAPDTSGLAIWDNAGAPLPLDVNSKKIGVRIVLSGGSSTTCGDPLVECYDASSSNGLLAIRGWDQSALSGAQPTPAVRDATLVDQSCSDGYFSTDTASCNVGVNASIDLGNDASGNPYDPGKVKVSAYLNGSTRKTYPLTYNTTTKRWENASLPMPTSAGATTVGLRWEETAGTWNGNACTNTGTNPCKGDLGNVQRHFSAVDSGSGPIQRLEVWEDNTYGAQSFALNSTHNLVVRVGLQGSLKDAQSVNDPVVVLRVAGGGSQNQSLDCDPNIPKLRDEIAQGCAPTYTENGGTACPATPTALWALAQPWNCVAIQTGAAVNQVPAGMNLRILGDEQASTCTNPNHWSQFPDLPPGDPRIVPVFLTSYGAFSGSGSEVVPVTNFATFYVTGWGASGSGFANPCQGYGDDVLAGNKSGYIYGHFIQYVESLNDGSGGTEPCDFNAFGTCIAQLVE